MGCPVKLQSDYQSIHLKLYIFHVDSNNSHCALGELSQRALDNLDEFQKKVGAFYSTLIAWRFQTDRWTMFRNFPLSILSLLSSKFAVVQPTIDEVKCKDS